MAYNFVKGLAESVMHPVDTAKGIYNVGLMSFAQTGIFNGGDGANAMMGGGYLNCMIFDAKFGTSTANTYKGLSLAFDNHANNLTSSDPNVQAEAIFDTAFAIFGTKGVGSLSKAKILTKIPKNFPVFHSTRVLGHAEKILMKIDINRLKPDCADLQSVFINLINLIL